MNEYVIECFNTEEHEFEYLRISAISVKEAIEHFKIQFGKQKTDLD